MSIIYVIYNYKYNYIGPLVTQVTKFCCMYAWSTMYLSNVPVHIGPYRFAYVVCRPYMYACLRTLHQFNVLLEISVALVPCVLSVMPSNNL